MNRMKCLINVVLKQHPSLIISSHDLPLMNGVQFVKSILRGDKKFYSPIIIMIDSRDENLIKTYHDVGVRTVISKPVDLKIVNREISIALN